MKCQALFLRKKNNNNKCYNIIYYKFSASPFNIYKVFFIHIKFPCTPKFAVALYPKIDALGYTNKKIKQIYTPKSKCRENPGSLKAEL